MISPHNLEESASSTSVSETESVTAPPIQPPAPSNRPSTGSEYAAVNTRPMPHGLPTNESFGSSRSYGAASNDPTLFSTVPAANPGLVLPPGVPNHVDTAAQGSNANPNDSLFAQYSGSQPPSVYRAFDPVPPAGMPNFLPNAQVAGLNTAYGPSAILSNSNDVQPSRGQHNPAFSTLVQQILTLKAQGWSTKKISDHVKARGWPTMSPDAVYSVWLSYKDRARFQRNEGRQR